MIAWMGFHQAVDLVVWTLFIVFVILMMLIVGWGTYHGIESYLSSRPSYPRTVRHRR